MTLFSDIIRLFGILDWYERRFIVFLIVLAVLISLLEIAQLALIFPVVANLTVPSIANDMAPIRLLVDWFELRSATQQILTFLLLMIAVSIVKMLLSLLFFYLQATLLSRGAERISRLIYRLYLYAPISFHLLNNTTKLLRNIRQVGANIFGMSVPGVLAIIHGGTSFLIISAFVLSINPFIVIPVAVFVATMVFMQQLINGKIFRQLGKERLELTRKVNWLVLGSLQAIKETQLLRAQRHFADRFSNYAFAELVNTRKHQFHGQTPGVLNDGILTIGIALAVGTAVLTVESQTVLPLLAVMFGAAYRYLTSANRISIGLNSLRNGSASVDTFRAEVTALGDRLPFIDLPPAKARRFERDLRFEDVTFSHGTTSTPSVRDLTFTIRKGEMIGIVGVSGAGKTTLANILLGLLQPVRGRVFVDGEDIANDIPAWQACVGYVPQHVVIADDSARRNVAFGVDDKDIDDERVIASLKDAQLLDRFRSERDGIEARLGERGARLSGGEIQRIGIARALYHGARILVLDEATSSLDSTTEAAITELIRRLSKNVTIVVIAHRLSTLRNVDRLLYLRDGRLIAEGSFEEISVQDAEFRELLRSAEFSLSPASEVAGPGAMSAGAVAESVSTRGIDS